MPTPTTDQLRDRIDRGLTGEKVAMPDLATVPLGTDAEAGGAPPTPQERAVEAASAPVAPTPRARPPGSIVYIFLVMCLALALIGIVLLAAM